MTSTRTSICATGAVLASLACLLLGSSAASAADNTPPRPVGGPRLASTDVVVSVPASATPLPRVSAKSYLIADLTTDAVLAAKNPHGRFRPASAIKVLTAVTLLPRLQPSQIHEATFEEANAEGSKVGIVPGGTYSVHNLFEGMFLDSGNDASQALAGAAGGMAKTVSLMNETARGLGALDTTAVNTSGLDGPGQYSSAYDLALFGRAGMKRADFRAYARTVKSQFPGKPVKAGEARKSFEIYTQNKLVLNYPGAIGIKTGWTTQARGTFIGAATRNGRTLIVTVMHTGIGAWREAAALLDWGFANAAVAQPVGTLDAFGGITTRAERNEMPDPKAADADSGSSPLKWLAWGLGLLAAFVGLRTRVLVKQAVRRRRHERRLMETAVAAKALIAALQSGQRPDVATVLEPHQVSVADASDAVGRSA